MGSSTALWELQRYLENKANDLSKLEKEIAKNHQVRKKYTIQLGEIELVLKDLAEANANVRKRIEYVSTELKRLDSTLQDLEGKQNSKKDGGKYSHKAPTESSVSSGRKSKSIMS